MPSAGRFVPTAVLVKPLLHLSYQLCFNQHKAGWMSFWSSTTTSSMPSMRHYVTHQHIAYHIPHEHDLVPRCMEQGHQGMLSAYIHMCNITQRRRLCGTCDAG